MEPFYPFASGYQILPVNLGELYDKDDIWDYIISGIEFNKIKGSITLQVDSSEPAGITPLGPAHLRKKYYNGLTTIEEVPLLLSTDFWIDNLQQLEDTKQFMIEAVFGRRKFYYPLAALRGMENRLEDLAVHGKTKLWSPSAYTKSGRERTIVVPQDFNKLSRIRMRFIEGGNFLRNLRKSFD